MSRLVAGHRQNITQEMAEKIALALNVSVAWLLTGSGDGPGIQSSIPPRPLKVRRQREAEIGTTRPLPEHLTLTHEDTFREAACVFAAAVGLSATAIAAVRGMPRHPYTAEEWLALIRVHDANLRLGHQNAR